MPEVLRNYAAGILAGIGIRRMATADDPRVLTRLMQFSLPVALLGLAAQVAWLLTGRGPWRRLALHRSPQLRLRGLPEGAFWRAGDDRWPPSMRAARG